MIPRVLGLLTAAILILPGAARAIDIQEVTSPGGIEAWLVEDAPSPSSPSRSGSMAAPRSTLPGKRGAVHLMTGLLEEGAEDMDARAFAEAVEGLAASFEFDVYRDALTVSARMLTENREEAADLLRAALVAPLRRGRGGTGARAGPVDHRWRRARPRRDRGPDLQRHAWGDHPYGSALEGTRESVSALTRDDLVDAHRAVLARDRVIVGAAGDITAEELGASCSTRSSAGSARDRRADARDGGLPAPPGTTVVDFPSPQSVALFGHQGIARDDPDFFPAFVLNQILGGGNFRSRLMQEVRVERGLTYGIYSYLGLAEYGQTMGALLLLQRPGGRGDRGDPRPVADLAENGVTESRARGRETLPHRRLPAAFRRQRTHRGHPCRDAGRWHAGGLHRHAQRPGGCGDSEDVRRVAARLLQPENLHFVVVGRPEGLEPSN
jgi:zinc protease